jgi:Ca2+-binding EF-hand superfamily protein
MEFLAAALDGKSYRVEECRAAFQVFDKNKSGRIDQSDLAGVLRSDQGNEDGLTSLSFEEFHELVTGGAADGPFTPKPRTNGTNGH